MAKTLDFNKIEQPTLVVVMRDEAQTKLSITAPSEALIEKLEANLGDIKEACSGKNREALDTAFDLAADFMSCNKEEIQLTGEELRGKYNVSYTMLLAFFVAYLEFIDEIKNAKN
jgi:hypothetical protein